MRIKPNLESLVYLLVIVLSLGALALMAASTNQFDITKVVYMGF
jgi:hypothetical protein